MVLEWQVPHTHHSLVLLQHGNSGSTIWKDCCIHVRSVRFINFAFLHLMRLHSKQYLYCRAIQQRYLKRRFHVRSIRFSHFEIHHFMRVYSKKSPCCTKLRTTLFEILIDWLVLVLDAIHLRIVIIWFHILCMWPAAEHTSNRSQPIIRTSYFHTHVTHGQSHEFDMYMVTIMHWSHRDGHSKLHTRLVLHPKVNHKLTGSCNSCQQFNVESRPTCHNNSQQNVYILRYVNSVLQKSTWSQKSTSTSANNSKALIVRHVIGAVNNKKTICKAEHMYVDILRHVNIIVHKSIKKQTGSTNVSDYLHVIYSPKF